MWAVSLLVLFLLGEGGKGLALEISDSPNYSCWPARGEPWLREPSHFSKTWPKLKLGYLGSRREGHARLGNGVSQGLGRGMTLVFPGKSNSSTWPGLEGPCERPVYHRSIR